MGIFTNNLNKKISHTQASRFKRDQFNTYMSTFEWRNVEVSKELGEHLKQGGSMFNYPFIRQTFGLIGVTLKSIGAANKYDSLGKVVGSEYGGMAALVDIFTVMEFIPKGLFALTLRPFMSKTNNTEIQQKIADYYIGYAERLKDTAFYGHDYGKYRKELRESYQQAPARTWTDAFTYWWVNTELFFREWISKPFKGHFYGEDNLVPPTTDAIVKFNTEIEDPEEAKQAFIAKIDKMKDQAHVAIVDNHVYAKERKNGKSYTSIYALLQTPRYGDFVETVKTFEAENIKIQKIAGNDHIQVKCEVNAKDASSFQQCQAALNAVKNATSLYSYGDDIRPNFQVRLFDVRVNQLPEAVHELDHAHEDARVRFIHNF